MDPLEWIRKRPKELGAHTDFFWPLGYLGLLLQMQTLKKYTLFSTLNLLNNLLN